MTEAFTDQTAPNATEATDAQYRELTTCLDADELKGALMAGINRVISHRDAINKINVFPVADADTGTNLAFTLHTVLAGIRDRTFDSVASFSRFVADLALDGARGNSGAIFAQFLQGFSEALDASQQIDSAAFAQAVRHGADGARGAIAEPREGTMLTVIADYASSLQSGLNDAGQDMVALMATGLEAARISLANTPNQLEVLRQHHVVDAGAQGFVELLEGMQLYLSGETELAEADQEFNADEELLASASEEYVAGEHRFCTECMVTGADIDRGSLRESILALGASSLVIAGTKGKVRVHAHVNNPGELFLACEDFGEISRQKADDMESQQRAAHGETGSVAIMTDSGADLPDAEIEQLNIHLVPLRVNIGERQYLDKVSLTPAELYDLAATSEQPPRTSQPPAGDFRRQFEFLGSHHDSVVCLNISSRVSGTWQSAAGAAARVGKDQLLAFDTGNASAGQGLIAMAAAECADAGADFDDLQAILPVIAQQTRTYAYIGDLAEGVRGGRIAPWVKSVADFLRATPVISNKPNGEIKPVGVIWGRSNLPLRFARWLARRVDNQPQRIIVAHCDNEAGARECRRELTRKLHQIHSTYLTEAGSALGAHAGRGTIIVGVQPFRRPREWSELAKTAQSANKGSAR